MPGCPPRPEAIIYGIVQLLKSLQGENVDLPNLKRKPVIQIPVSEEGKA